MSIIARLLSKIVYRFNGVIDVEKTERYKFQLDVFRASPRDDDVIVMLGDSLTENTPFNELLHFRFRVKNRGISSDNTRGVLARIDEAANNLPEKMFILLGTNDIGNGEMDGTCTADGLHLNGTGMLRWCGFLEQYM